MLWKWSSANLRLHLLSNFHLCFLFLILDCELLNAFENWELISQERERGQVTIWKEQLAWIHIRKGFVSGAQTLGVQAQPQLHNPHLPSIVCKEVSHCSRLSLTRWEFERKFEWLQRDCCCWKQNCITYYCSVSKPIPTVIFSGKKN